MRGLRQAAGFYWVAAFILVLFALPSWPAPYAHYETTFVLLGSAMMLAGAVAVPVVYLRSARRQLTDCRGCDVSVALVVLATASAGLGVALSNPLLVIFSLLAGGVAGVHLWLKAPIIVQELETTA